jgi:hypothetical protein
VRTALNVERGMALLAALDEQFEVASGGE